MYKAHASHLLHLKALEREDKQLILDCKRLVADISQCAVMSATDTSEQLIPCAMKLQSEIEAIEALMADRRTSEQTLIESNEILQCFSQETLEVLEYDRQRMAKELCDVIGAGLAAIKIIVEEKQYQIERKEFAPDFSLKPVVVYLMNIIKEIKAFSSQLRPSTLDDLGLVSTLASYCRKFGGYHREVDVNCQIDVIEEQIPEKYKIILFRILQEAMSNAANHGQPTFIRSILDIDDDYLRLMVQDDGNDYDRALASSYKPLRAFEFQRMRTQAEICGGTFSIDSQNGAGTLVKVLLPLALEC